MTQSPQSHSRRGVETQWWTIRLEQDQSQAGQTHHMALVLGTSVSRGSSGSSSPALLPIVHIWFLGWFHFLYEVLPWQISPFFGISVFTSTASYNGLSGAPLRDTLRIWGSIHDSLGLAYSLTNIFCSMSFYYETTNQSEKELFPTPLPTPMIKVKLGTLGFWNRYLRHRGKQNNQNRGSSMGDRKSPFIIQIICEKQNYSYNRA